MSDDLISRQAAIDEIHKYFLSELDKEETEIIDGWEVFVDDILTHNKEICTRIKNLPSAHPQRIMSKWLKIPTFEGWEYICDQCGAQSDFKKISCPKCGAEMVNVE